MNIQLTLMLMLELELELKMLGKKMATNKAAIKSLFKSTLFKWLNGKPQQECPRK